MAGSTRAPSAEGLTARRAAVVSCWMCGTRLNPDHMVPDGASACDDIRWYCRDTRACTDRWTSARYQAPAAVAAPPGDGIAALSPQTAKPAVPDPIPQSRKGGRGDEQ